MPHPNRAANLKNGSPTRNNRKGVSNFQPINCPERIMIECWPELRMRNVGNRARTSKDKRGVITRMTTFQYLAWMFDVNEALPASMKMTDLVIAMNFSREFPSSFLTEKLLHPRKRETYSIRYFRSMYNRGQLKNNYRKNAGLEGPVSFRYNADGERLTSAGVSVLTPEKVAAMIRRHKPKGNFTPAELEIVAEKKKHTRNFFVQVARVKTPEHQDGPEDVSQAASSEDVSQADVQPSPPEGME